MTEHLSTAVRHEGLNEATIHFRDNGVQIAGACITAAKFSVDNVHYDSLIVTILPTAGEKLRTKQLEEIFRRIRSIATERDIDFLITVPAGNEDYHTLMSLGFRSSLYEKQVDMDAKALRTQWRRILKSTGAPGEHPYSSYVSVRETALKNTDHVVYDDKFLRYLFLRAKQGGGNLILNNDGYAVYRYDPETEHVTVREMLTASSYSAMLEKLLETGAGTFSFYLPADAGLNGGKTKTVRSGMTCAISQRARAAEKLIDKAYLGIALG